MKNSTQIEFEKTAAYICTLCGFPAVTPEKMKVLIGFLRENHGYNTLEQLQAAFNALAAGRLNEKLESIKSLTGLSAARVLQSYLRENVKGPMQPERGSDGRERRFVNDDNKRLINERFGRYVVYADELSKAETDYLMEYWMGENRKHYYENKSYSHCTVTAFDYLERNGSIRVKDGKFQYFDGKTFLDICPWEQVKDGGLKVKFNDDQAVMKARQSDFRSMRTHNPGVNLADAEKRFAVSLYFEQIA